MDEVISIEVTGQEEGTKLIKYLASQGSWVTPFVYTQGNSYCVKAAISQYEMEQAIAYIRE